MAHASESPTALARSGTLSWQQRRRPLSHIATENNRSVSPKPVTHSPVPNENEPSRAQIAESLSLKDPSWFKQTSDRGIGSAAYRKTQDYPEEQASSGASSGRFKLAGIAKETSTIPDTTMSPPPDPVRSISPSRTSSIRGSESWSNRYSATSTSDAGLPSTRTSSIYDAPRLTPTTTDAPSAPFNSGRLSPTKGLGGFVQSAMLKRSDSMSKRWSGTGLSRQGSTASNRNSFIGKGDASYANPSRVDARPSSSLSRGDSLEPSSRPSSSHSNQTITQSADEDKDVIGRSKGSLHNRSKSMVSLKSVSEIGDDKKADFTSPPSPSKRWSPTKSSWLESKITKAEEKPKPTPPPPSQPSWMSNLAKANKQRNSAVIEDLPNIPGQSSPIKPSSPEPISTPKPVELKLSVSAPEPTPEPAPKPAPKPTPKPILSTPKDLDTSSASKKIPTSESVTSPPRSDTKPTIPGKHDFRANLKPRAQTNDGGNGNELEFRNALGKLRRTQAEKYVAPDTLKNNILRGKAGLTITGGPAKRERVDELKESLIKQKEAMKAKAAAEPKSPPEKPKALGSTPEALAARNALNRREMPVVGQEKRGTSPEALLKQKEVREKAKPSVPIKPNSPPSRVSTKPEPSTVLRTTQSVDTTPSKVSTRPLPSAPAKGPVAQGALSGKLMGRLNPALAGMLARGPPPMTTSSTESKAADTSSASSSIEPPKESRELTHMTKGRARGPKRRAPKATADEVESETTISTAPAELKSDTSLKADITSTEPISTRKEETPSPAPFAQKLEAIIKPRPLPSTPKPNLEPSSSASAPKDISPLKAGKEKPPTPSKSPNLIMKSQDVETFLVPIQDSTRSVSAEINSMLESIGSGVDTTLDFPSAQRPRTPPMSKDSGRPKSPIKSLEQSSRSPERPSSSSVKDVAKRWSRQEEPATTQSPSRPRSPVKLPTWADEQKSLKDVEQPSKPQSPPKSAKPIPNLGLGLFNVRSQNSNAEVKEANLNKKLPMSPPSSAGLAAKYTGRPTPEVPPEVPPKNLPTPASFGKSPSHPYAPASPEMTRKVSRPPSISIKIPPSDSPIPHTSEAARMFSEFFDDQPHITSEPEIDVLQMLEADPLESEKIETIRKQVQEITSDGKLLSVPSHQEHILFEESMYVCVHTFQAGKSKITEVYLWSGLGVSPASVEDAQLFAKRIAKENSGKLILIRQGKETPIFFQALGGIVITFRGTRSKVTTTSLPEKFVLCGRRHLGHVSFDEVDFSVSAFCSGFPYLVSANSKLYLWKGEGCTADELGCARLIAMDIGPTPEVIEISDGKEPISFLGLFPSPTKSSKIPHMPPSASHWRLKPSMGDKYLARLFRVQQRPSVRKNSISASAFQVSSFFLGGWATSLRLPAAESSPTTPALPLSAYNKNNAEMNNQNKSFVLNSAAPSTPKSPANGNGTIECTVEEVIPFSREDLLSEGVYVLDAFFEMYM
jgi:Domain of unknown function (DUF4045)/Gelsolin repeat